MKKALSVLSIVLFLFSCTEKQKSYEELEAEVLCDVLPEVLERELKFYSVKIPPPPQTLDSLKYNDKQLDSIKIQGSLSWDKLSVDETVYLKSELDPRKVGLDEFNNSNINVNLVPYSNTFEGQDRNSGEQVLFLTRVLIDEKGENSFFTVFKFFGTYHVFCRKLKNNKWEIRKVIPDDNNKLRLE